FAIPNGTAHTGRYVPVCQLHLDRPLAARYRQYQPGYSLVAARLREKRRRRKKENREKKDNGPRRKLFHTLSQSRSDAPSLDDADLGEELKERG
ncbi:hypothetical protein GW17_00052425, partial [Ensete ventricosum]